MIASTARMTGPVYRPEIAGSELWDGYGARMAPIGSGLRAGSSQGVIQVTAAAHADLVVQGHHVAALRALAPGLVSLEPVEQRRDRPDDGEAGPDQEPEQERGALDLRHDSSRQAAEEDEDEERAAGHEPDLENADRPDDRDHREHGHQDPRDRGHHADHELEQDPGGGQQDHERESPAAQIRCSASNASGALFHAPSVAEP